MTGVLLAILIVVVIGIVCGAILAVASYFMSVPVNEKEKQLRESLPGANCGACGYTGCDGYAKALAGDDGIATNLCIPGADPVSKRISEILGVEFQDVIEQVAFVHCHGDCNTNKHKQIYKGIETCSAAYMLYGGKGMCTHGCMGYGDCVKVCPNDAICMELGIAHINPHKCTGCGLCAKTCPNKVIDLMPDTFHVVVTCSNHDKGAIIMKKCSGGCITCGKCVRCCPADAIELVNNLPVIDYDKCIRCGKCASSCPVHAIKFADFSGEYNSSKNEDRNLEDVQVRA